MEHPPFVYIYASHFLLEKEDFQCYANSTRIYIYIYISYSMYIYIHCEFHLTSLRVGPVGSPWSGFINSGRASMAPGVVPLRKVAEQPQLWGNMSGVLVVVVVVRTGGIGGIGVAIVVCSNSNSR